MVSRLGFTSILFRLGDPTASAAATKPTSSSWAWASCKQHPRTDDSDSDDTVYKNSNVNSAHESTYSCFSRSSEESFSTSDDDADGSESLIRGLVKTDRLLFEPGGDTSSILEESAKVTAGGGDRARPRLNPFEGSSVVMAVASDDPYLDFRKSMEEMVAALGMKDWGRLEELLAWYLSVNGKKTHGYIVGAFVDMMMVGLVAPSAPDHGSGADLLPCSNSSSSSSFYEVGEE